MLRHVLPLLGASLAVHGVSLAGPLAPPAGPVAPTNKTLQQVEPRTPLSADTTPGDTDSVFRITQPGSYYLTENLAVPSGDSGIEISTGGVTIDLNGFAITGATGSVSGIVVNGTQNTITITNGHIIATDGHGIDLGFVRGARVHNVSVRSCELAGIRAVGEAGVFTDCFAEFCGEQGFLIGERAVLHRCTSARNEDHGFDIDNGAAVELCTARFNDGDGFRVGGTSTVDTCHAAGNGPVGFRLGANCVVRGCAAEGHSQFGFSIGQTSVVTHCSARLADIDGFTLSTNCHIEACVAQNNDDDGIQAGNNSYILNNTSSFNGANSANGAGIEVTGTANRIEGNLVSDQDLGLFINNIDNLVIRNSAHGNSTNYSINAGSVFGQIVALPAGGQIPTPDPWANFEF